MQSDAKCYIVTQKKIQMLFLASDGKGLEKNPEACFPPYQSLKLILKRYDFVRHIK